MSAENEKAITNQARKLYGTQNEFCREFKLNPLNFSTKKKNAIRKLENIIEPLNLVLIIKEKSEK